MKIEFFDVADVCVIALTGRLDSNTVVSVEQPICDKAKSGAPLVLDLSDMSYVSSAGLRVFLRAAKLMKVGGRRLVISGLSQAVREVFEVSGFVPLFDIEPDRDSAVATAG